MDNIVSRTAERSYDIKLNVAIWMAFKPIIKVYLSIGTGFALSKTNILTPQLSKGISRLLLLIFMPCLLFNNIVSNIKDTDIKLFGVIIFTGFMYYMIGLGWGFIVRLLTPIPRAWFGGLILCCMLNNCSDLPLAYVQAIGKSPFLPSDFAARGEAYCVLIVIIFIIINFNLGGTRLVEWDAKREDPRRGEPTVPPVSWSGIKHEIHNIFSRKRRNDNQDTSSESNNEQTIEKQSTDRDLEAQVSTAFTEHEGHVNYSEQDHLDYLGAGNAASSKSTKSNARAQAEQERPFGSTEVYYARRPSQGSLDPLGSAHSDVNSVDRDAPLAFQNLELSLERSRSRASDVSNGLGSIPNSSSHASHSSKFPWFKRKWANFKKAWFRFKSKNTVTLFVCNAIEDIFLPQMLALLAGIAVAMIPWVRRVFVKGQNIKNFHDAPDGSPPLDFIMDFLSFFAAASVPLGLMLLGSTIASLKPGKLVKGFWKSLILIVLFKLAILPIIACAWIHRMRKIGWIDKDDVMTPIVLGVASGTPSATVQIYLTLAWIDPTKESLELNCLATALLAQYALLPITLTIVMTYVVMNFV